MRRITLAVAVLIVLGSMVPAAATAQGSDSIPGITAIGYGHASAPAATANLQFLIMFNYFYGGAPAAGAGEVAPQVPEATPGAQTRAFVDPIVQRVREIEGVESVEVVIPFMPPYQRDPNVIARLDVTFASPTQDSLTSLYYGVSEAAFDNRLMVGNVGASFTAADCAALEREARQAAIDDARARASLQAELLDVGVGDVVASEDVMIPDVAPVSPYSGLPQSPGPCDPPTRTPGASGEYYGGITLPPFNPTVQTGQVDVYRQVRVTFELDTGGSLT